MPTNWPHQVRAAITNLEINTARALEPDRALALIDDVVAGKLAACDLAPDHRISEAVMKATLGQVTHAVQGKGRVLPLEAGGWYAFHAYEHPYEVAPGFAAAWRKARGLP